MPDLAGYSKRSLLPLLERPDIRVVIEGDGYVVSQKPLPGTVLVEGSRVQFTLE
jgi:cell division protein FtsI (penicillin-binding protein 3)